ncbi:MAG: rRNA maturation RNase YbeY [Deltaproteobacteria bacterium]|nr:rRNA maturation RNase YbeY [Deltaproteobacteria bacterium]
MTLLISNEHPRSRISRRSLETGTRKILRHLGLRNKILGITLVTDRAIASLNFKHLKKKGPTDVLSFPMEEEKLLGDIVISLDTAGRQARALGISIKTRSLTLIIHGLLHLLGYDHVKEGDFQKMSAKETELKTLLRIL